MSRFIVVPLEGNADNYIFKSAADAWDEMATGLEGGADDSEYVVCQIIGIGHLHSNGLKKGPKFIDRIFPDNYTPPKIW